MIISLTYVDETQKRRPELKVFYVLRLVVRDSIQFFVSIFIDNDIQMHFAKYF